MEKDILESHKEKERKALPLPYFIEYQKSENKKIKIPCSNETVAKRVLSTLSKSNNNGQSKACPEWNEGSNNLLQLRLL